MSSSPPGSKKKDKRILSGSCPDPACQARLFFPAQSSAASIECTECGQRHEQRSLLRMEEVTDPDVVLHNLLRHALLGVTGAPKKGPELVKVAGLSNYHCKLLSPTLTRYGMDRQSGQARLLSDMNQGDMFDCALLADRAFLIEREHLDSAGYGQDRSGSLLYLRDTLAQVRAANGDQERLVPVHVDGDGHCLVHAVSRALVGRELFWHALRENLRRHFASNLPRYRALFADFIDAAEWDDIISECDPRFTPPEGVPLGLRNVHVFGLANVLRRPVLLLDSLSGMSSPGDYSATFLPGLVPPDDCRDRHGDLNKPICLAWSSSAHNHYIPLVGVRGAGPPRLPNQLLPKAWGVPQELIGRYMALDEEGGCVIGGERSLGDGYLRRLVVAMDAVFEGEHGVSAALVADVHHYVFRRRGVVNPAPEEVTASARRWLSEGRLHRCLACGGVSELSVPRDWLSPGGKLHALATRTHGALQSERSYSFPLMSLVCVYDAAADALMPDYARSSPAACHTCHSSALRPLSPHGGVLYRDGDRTSTPSGPGSKCGCGFKHYWAGGEYDNLPEELPVTLDWAGRVVRETVHWWQYESDAALNSNAYEVAARLVDQHFPGEFGSEPLVQKVVTSILQQTARRGPDQYRPVSVEHAHTHTHADTHTHTHTPPSKIILTGHKSRTLHREELTMSKAELRVQQSIRDHAPQTQQRHTHTAKDDGHTRTHTPKADGPTHTHTHTPKADGPTHTHTHTPKTDGQADSASSSSSAPPTPTKAPPPASGEKKIRVTTSDGRQATLTLQPRTNHAELQRAIAAAFSIPPGRQRIRAGFPPRPLPPPADASDDTPVPLQHGERVSVEVLRTEEESEVNGGEEDERRTAEEERRGGDREERREERRGGDREERREESMSRAERELQDNIDLEISSLCLLATLMGEDVWSYAKKLPHLFQPGGVFYNIVKKDMGLLDGKHCSLPQLSGRVFVYSSRDDRLELCADAAGHFPIGPGVDEMAKEAGLKLPADGSPSHAGMRLGSGGVVRKKEAASAVPVFQGKGHSLGSSPATPLSEHRPITRQHSSGVDLSGSVAPPLERELVRMAPGVVTTAMRDARGLDPVAVETQRKRLQEMVWSIQASMDKHTHAQSATLQTQEQQEAEQMEEDSTPTEPMDQS
ncbi:deubiquitinating protein VCPIP1 isoform X1 [Alosa sapidissima]|uniref:deubiquitinating protein VCPIP1 isoform X1 n=1 Tax=Alosa sapidissima TaxID=34773 RepID=UPI001C09AF49|nr:deubiquitinating protein VCPIP1 isoform X1 [Alosa sapidissima]